MKADVVDQCETVIGHRLFEGPEKIIRPPDETFHQLSGIALSP